MTPDETLAVLHAYWMRHASGVKFALVQVTLANAGWLYVDQFGDYRSCRPIKQGDK